jgi:DNA-binding CsgD family transcriptional regulator
MTTIPDFALAEVRLDGATQVRLAISEPLVVEYAARMADGATFPAVVVFYDGQAYYLADGFHRCHAAERAGRTTIAAEVRPGNQTDALWFALGANGAHGERLTVGDRKHAIKVAIQAFPERSGAEIARHIGCSHQWVSDVKQELRSELQASCSLPDQVVGADGRHYPATRQTATTVHPQAAEIVTRLKAGQSSEAIASALKVSSRTVAKVRQSTGMVTVDRSPEAVARRIATIRTMAAEGYTSRQICAAVRLGIETVHNISKRESIDIPADRVVGKTQRHNANRIVGRIVMDAETLTDGVELVNFMELDPAQIPDWLRALKAARDNLGVFIRRLMQEQQSHVEDQP